MKNGKKWNRIPRGPKGNVDDMHSMVYRVYTAKTWTAGVVVQDYSTSVRSIESSPNYFNTITSHFNEIRVDAMEFLFAPSAAYVYNTQLSPLPFVSLPYHGKDIPALHTTSQALLSQLEATTVHKASKNVRVSWVANKNDPEEMTFYPTSGTLANPVIPDMGGVYALTVLNNGATATGTNIGVLLVSYHITLRQFRIQ
jgi:hypothetical protein